jgi:hypothetical protein
MNLDFFNRDRGNFSPRYGFSFLNFFIKELDAYLNHTNIENGLYQIDRFEGDDTIFAVCQNLDTLEMINIPKALIPKEADYAFVLRVENGSFYVDYEETKKYVKDI